MTKRGEAVIVPDERDVLPNLPNLLSDLPNLGCVRLGSYVAGRC